MMNRGRGKCAWSQIQPTIINLFNGVNISRSEWHELFMLLYQSSMNLREAERVDKNFRELLEVYILRIKNELIVASESMDTFWEKYQTEWKRFMHVYDFLPLPFSALRESLADFQYDHYRPVMAVSWLANVFEPVIKPVIPNLMELVNKERQDSKIQLSDSYFECVKETCLIIESKSGSPNFYKIFYETPYLEAMQEYYGKKSKEYYSEKGILAYLKWVSDEYSLENERRIRFLECSSENKFTEILSSLLIGKYKEESLELFKILFKEEKLSDMQLVYSLLKKVNALPQLNQVLRECLYESLKSKFRRPIKDFAFDPVVYIESLNEAYKTTTGLVNSITKSDSDSYRLFNARDKTMSSLINDKKLLTSQIYLRLSDNKKKSSVETDSVDNLSEPADVSNNNLNPNIDDIPECIKSKYSNRNLQLFADYFHKILRRNRSELELEETKIKLRNCIKLVTFIEDVDSFLDLYKGRLTRRLIFRLSTSEDLERWVLNSFEKSSFPQDKADETVIEMDRFFKDLDRSNDVVAQFNSQYLIDQPEAVKIQMAKVNVDLRVLRYFNWTKNDPQRYIPVKLPTEITGCLSVFEQFYRQTFDGRKLYWPPEFSHGIITFNSDIGSYDLDVTSYEASVLFAWDECQKDVMSFQELINSTNLSEHDLRKTLWNLFSHPKLKEKQLLLLEDRDNGTIKSHTDFDVECKFQLNMQFCLLKKNGGVCKRGRINLMNRYQ